MAATFATHTEPGDRVKRGRPIERPAAHAQSGLPVRQLTDGPQALPLLYGGHRSLGRRPAHPDDEHGRPAAQRPFFTREQVHDLVVRSRMAQGLPLTITDASVLDLVARIFGPPRPATRVGVVRDLACGHPGEDQCRPSRLAS